MGYSFACCTCEIAHLLVRRSTNVILSWSSLCASPSCSADLYLVAYKLIVNKNPPNMSLVNMDKKKTERSNVSVSAAFNDAKLRKTPSTTFPQDGSVASAANPSASNLSTASAAKSPRGKVIPPSSISKLPQLSQQSQQQSQQGSTSNKPPSSPQTPPDKLEANAPATPGGGESTPV